MEADPPAARRAFHDAEWTARHSRLDTSLTVAIRPPLVDGRFDEQVWALIRARAAEDLEMQRMLRMSLGTPWWLDSLNVIAIAATAVVIALALGATEHVAGSAAAALALVEQASESLRAFAVAASAAAFWFGLRQAPFVRALVRAWL